MASGDGLTLTGKHLKLIVRPIDTVEDLKLAIQGRKGTPPEMPRIIFSGTEPEDWCLLEVQEGDCVNVVIRFWGC
ncbi:Nmr based structural model of the Ubch8-ubiquitin complex [Hyaloraphidium curvatum]|nr:Nmr based structural model of the Ubch8-ubiquitin complex [Hyaloraphidium curvatum]